MTDKLWLVGLTLLQLVTSSREFTCVSEEQHSWFSDFFTAFFHLNLTQSHLPDGELTNQANSSVSVGHFKLLLRSQQRNKHTNQAWGLVWPRYLCITWVSPSHVSITQSMEDHHSLNCLIWTFVIRIHIIIDTFFFFFFLNRRSGECQTWLLFCSEWKRQQRKLQGKELL